MDLPSCQNVDLESKRNSHASAKLECNTYKNRNDAIIPCKDGSCKNGGPSTQIIGGGGGGLDLEQYSSAASFYNSILWLLQEARSSHMQKKNQISLENQIWLVATL